MSPEESSDHLLKAITEVAGGMVTGFAVVASFMDDDGDRRIFSTTMQDQRCHETIGLLGFGLAVENHVAARSWGRDE